MYLTEMVSFIISLEKYVKRLQNSYEYLEKDVILLQNSKFQIK